MISNDTHDAWDELLPEYAAGQLGGIEREQFEAHLAACPHCEHELERLRALASFLTHEDADAPSDRAFEAGWNRLVASLPPRESVTATVHDGRPLGILDMGEFQGSEISSRSLPFSASTKRKGAQWRETVRLMVAVTALVAIVGSLAVIGLHHAAGPGGNPLPSSKWALSSTPPAPTGLPTGAILSDVTMASATEGWAAGSIVDLDRVKGEYTVKQGLILHYQHGNWAVSPDSPPHIQLLQFWTLAPGELWAWGRQIGQVDTVFLKYQDGRWQHSVPPMPFPTRADGAHFVMSEIRARTKDDVWAVGGFVRSTWSNTDPAGPKINFDGAILGGRSGLDLMLWHYNGSGWTSVPNMSAVGEVAPAGPDEAWVLSSPSPLVPRVVVHMIYGVATVSLNVAEIGNITNLTVISPTDVWASGTTWPWNATAQTNPETAILYHYDGASWTRSSLQIPSYISNITITGHDTLLGLTYDSVQDKRFGPTVRITQAFVYRDMQWQQVPWSIHQMLAEYGLKVTSAGDDVWAVGTYDIVWSTRNRDATVPDLDGIGSVLLHYTNGAWTQYGS